MNPSCQRELFCKNGDIIEKAHMVPYCETVYNSFETLVLLCPNCHTEFDKNHAFTLEEVLGWEETRRKEIYVQSFTHILANLKQLVQNKKKNREILFPSEINSMFGITPVEDL